MFKVILISSLLLGGDAVTQNSTEPYWFNSGNNTIVVEDHSGEAELDLNTIEYIENEEEFELGFDTTPYLPDGFDPYLGSLDAIEYIDIEQGEPELESEKNLPNDFDPYVGSLGKLEYIDLDKMEFETGLSMASIKCTY